ncbi:Hypothetical protein BRZCDTV_143, partial [Brazilian cedratvirus IHUMI]
LVTLVPIVALLSLPSSPNVRTSFSPKVTKVEEGKAGTNRCFTLSLSLSLSPPKVTKVEELPSVISSEVTLASFVDLLSTKVTKVEEGKAGTNRCFTLFSLHQRLPK